MSGLVITLDTGKSGGIGVAVSDETAIDAGAKTAAELGNAARERASQDRSSRA